MCTTPTGHPARACSIRTSTRIREVARRGLGIRWEIVIDQPPARARRDCSAHLAQQAARFSCRKRRAIIRSRSASITKVYMIFVHRGRAQPVRKISSVEDMRRGTLAARPSQARSDMASQSRRGVAREKINSKLTRQGPTERTKVNAACCRSGTSPPHSLVQGEWQAVVQDTLNMQIFFLLVRESRSAKTSTALSIISDPRTAGTGQRADPARGHRPDQEQSNRKESWQEHRH